MLLYRILVGLSVFAFVTVSIAQVVLPLWRGGVLFPALRRNKKEKKTNG